MEKLPSFLHPDQVSTATDDLKTYGQDWTRYYQPNPKAVVFPKSTEEVQKIVKWANANQQKLVVSGGRTGLSGGAVAKDNEIVLSLEKMNKIHSINELDMTIQVDAGVITEALQQHLQEKGYLFPVDFAARGSSHIGGNIATNAGGIKVLRYGLTRDWVSSLTVVTGEGEILKLNQSLVKNATGYDFRHLFIGNEGTLGIVTEAEIRFTHPHGPLQSLLLAVPDLDSVMKIFKIFRKHTSLMAFEMFTDVAMKYVAKSTGLPPPLSTDAPIYLLVEVEKTTEKAEEDILKCFEQCMEDGLVVDGVMSQSAEQAKIFWRFREDITESLAFATPYKNDVSVKISNVPDFMRAIDAIYKQEYSEFEVVWFGHIG
ncbi:MAG: FAD-binding oxidoreductase, partial [Bdellovibrionales bacterium]|nr:FAD-binding oxidoreductase [Bdellovibrionales bacterium]